MKHKHRLPTPPKMPCGGSVAPQYDPKFQAQGQRPPSESEPVTQSKQIAGNCPPRSLKGPPK